MSIHIHTYKHMHFSQLHNVVSQVDHAAAEQLQPPVGIMTSENRDTWAKVRQKLESNPTNTDTLHAIDTSLFVVCLDYYSSPDNIDKSHRNMFHGQEARNRWFDKSIQLIVENNGRAGVNGEVMKRDDGDKMITLLMHLFSTLR